MTEAQFWNYLLVFVMFSYGVIGAWFHGGKLYANRKERKRIEKIRREWRQND